MSDNPFDVFAADFRAAIPSTNDPAKQQQQQQSESINIMAEPTSAPVPVMNSAPAPPMNSAPQPPPMSMAGPAGGMMAPPPPAMGTGAGAVAPGGYGAPPPVYGNGMNGGVPAPGYGNPPPPPPNAYGGMGGMGAGMNTSMAAPAPTPTMGGMGGAPPPPVQQPWNSNASMTGSMNGGASMTAGGAMVPSANPSNPYATMMNSTAPPPQPPAPATATAPATSDPFGMQPHSASAAPAPPTNNMYGAPPPTQQPPSTMPTTMGAPPPAAPMPPPPVPVAVPDSTASVEPSVMTSDPWASAPPTQPHPPHMGAPVPAQPGAIVPTNAPSGNDPFDIFAGGPPPQPAPVAHTPVAHAPVQVPVPGGVPQMDDRSVMTPGAPPAFSQEEVLQAADDPWSQMGFGEAPTPSSAAPPSTTEGVPAIASGEPNLLGGDDGLTPTAAPTSEKDGQLPPGGEWYDARIYTPTLGVMFFKPQELTDSLFLQTDRSLVDTLQDRPVVAFIVEGSSARAAGVELGHVLLKVNDIDVKNPKEASRLIKEGPRPLPLLFYVPDTTVVVAEGEHMVKYDTRETGAPNSAKDWKPKYVVIGGIIAQPWMMNMYRSKSEYDIAVIETQARRPVSVKVKQFSLQGARIQNDWQGPQMVKYKNKLHPWKYIVILPVSRNPIKISSPNLSQLKPVHEGVRRVLMAQQRHQPTSAPVQRADPYGQPPEDGQYGGPPPGGAAPPGVGVGGQPSYGGPPPGGNMYDTQGGVSSARRTSQY